MKHITKLKTNIDVFIYIYKVIRKIKRTISLFYCNIITLVKFKGNGVVYKDFKTTGIPFVSVAQKGELKIGNNFCMNNAMVGNPVGVSQPCTFFVDTNCSLLIGNNVGISQAALISHCSLRIGDNVKIGGGTCIYTTDFHAIDAQVRMSNKDIKERKTAAVFIGNNVFIGAKCIILKGVSIGENSIIGAGSVVTKNIPSNQIWAGNPARFIRSL